MVNRNPSSLARAPSHLQRVDLTPQVLRLALTVEDPMHILVKGLRLAVEAQVRVGRDAHAAHLAPPVGVRPWRARLALRHRRRPAVGHAVHPADEVSIDDVGGVRCVSERFRPVGAVVTQVVPAEGSWSWFGLVWFGSVWSERWWLRSHNRQRSPSAE